MRLFPFLTWLNLRVKATALGAELCFSFLFQPQLDNSCKQGDIFGHAVKILEPDKVWNSLKNKIGRSLFTAQLIIYGH